MSMKQGKVFQKNNSNELSFFDISEKNYYQFIREKSYEGFKQAIFDSNALILILEYIFVSKNGDIVEINLLEQDYEYEKKLENLLTEVKNNRDKIISFFKELSFLTDDSSFDIKSIKMKYRNTDDKLFIFTMSVNGLITYKDNDIAEKEIEILLDYLQNKSGLFWYEAEIYKVIEITFKPFFWLCILASKFDGCLPLDL